MPTDAKRETVAELRDELSRSSTYVVSEYRGLRVGDLAEIRRSLRRQNVSYRIVKNRLMRIAAADTGASALSSLLTGPTAIAFGSDEAATAKAVLDATKPFKLVKVTGAVIGGRVIDAEGVVRLAALPSRDVLHAQLAGAMQAPIATLGGLFSANLRNLAYALQQVADRKAEAAGA
jgi:large subunit ribosomal protein L10